MKRKEMAMMAKVFNALTDAPKLSREELQAVWDEAQAYRRTLPTPEERFAFYWDSGMEALSFMVKHD